MAWDLDILRRAREAANLARFPAVSTTPYVPSPRIEGVTPTPGVPTAGGPPQVPAPAPAPGGAPQIPGLSDSPLGRRINDAMGRLMKNKSGGAQGVPPMVTAPGFTDEGFYTAMKPENRSALLQTMMNRSRAGRTQGA